jgi:thioesterase domain-containing protein
MLGRVATELGPRLPVSVMIQHPTIASLAELIEGADYTAASSIVVKIQPAGDRPPLFCVHPFTGDILWFNELGRSLAPEQPLFGLQARNLVSDHAPAMSIEEMASWYVEAMRSVQSTGPYLVAGASFGGLVAYEIARQLEAAGEEVALLGIFDYDPYTPSPRKELLIEALQRHYHATCFWWRQALLPRTSHDRQWVRWRVRTRFKQGVTLLLGGAKLPIDAADLVPYSIDLPLNRRELLIANEVALSKYTPKPIDGRLTLFATGDWSTQHAIATGSSDWSTYARGGVDIVSIPGAHESMFQAPHVDELARELRRLIGAALAARKPDNR